MDFSFSAEQERIREAIAKLCVRFGDDYGNPPTEQMAIAVLATIPIFLLFLLLQRALRKGFDLSALKG